MLIKDVHDNRYGKIDGRTPAGVAVHNVAISLLQAQQPSSLYRIFDL
ncbi:MAG TPA: hypothetical protein VFF64_21090 [Candidatus Eremiobacteraceae bacterium]|nr:hypothetical protein [Candidatus Eremiobacteraceae bacterium]